MFLHKLIDDWSSPMDSSRNSIVFENRNQQYGAFVLRKEYNQSLVFSVVAASSLFIALLSMQFLAGNTVPVVKHFSTDEMLTTFIDNTPKDDPILDPVKKLDPPAGVDPPSLPVKGINLNNVELDNHSLTNSNLPVITDANANPNATSADNDKLPPSKLPESNTSGTGGGTSTESNEIVLAPDVLPTFVGGEEALSKFFKQNVSYPRSSIDRDEEAKVIVKFVVEKDGSVGASEIVRGGKYAALNAEALRVIKKMPNWLPGMSGGKPARVYFYVPINFVIAQN